MATVAQRLVWNPYAVVAVALSWGTLARLCSTPRLLYCCFYYRSVYCLIVCVCHVCVCVLSMPGRN